jgi:hypothetical protein
MTVPMLIPGQLTLILGLSHSLSFLWALRAWMQESEVLRDSVSQIRRGPRDTADPFDPYLKTCHLARRASSDARLRPAMTHRGTDRSDRTDPFVNSCT